MSKHALYISGAHGVTLDGANSSLEISGFDIDSPLHMEYVPTVTSPVATGFVVNSGVSVMIKLTQAEYNAIGTPDESTLYIIVG